MRNITLALLLSITAYSQTRPDFSGRWTLNKARSRAHNPQQFKHSAMEVSQHDSALDIRIRDVRPDGREFRAYLDLKTDGTPAVAILGAPQRAVVHWQGNKMIIRWNMDGRLSSGGSGRQGAAPPFTWTWALSPNGKVLVNDIHLYGDVTGDIVEHLVYRRAP